MSFFLHVASLLYRGLVWVRTQGYRFRFLKTYKFNTPVVSVGNIAVGGTGKTPMVIFLSQLLTKNKIKHVIVSRGYGNLGRGTMVVQDYRKKQIDNPSLAGDEPIMMTYKLKNIPIIVDNKKQIGIAAAIERFNPQMILLDDGFQSLYIDKNKDCVLIDLSLPITQYQLMPRGRLREPLLALKRADFVVFLNKGSINSSIKETLVPILDKYTVPYLDAHFKSKLYQHNYNTQSLEKQENKEALGQPCVTISGIGNAQSFIDTANRFCNNVFKNYSFPDHYSYLENEEHFDALVRGEREGGKGAVFGIITTLKDYVKIVQLSCVQLKKYSLYVIDVNVVTDNNDKLLELILGKGRKG